MATPKEHAKVLAEIFRRTKRSMPELVRLGTIACENAVYDATTDLQEDNARLRECLAALVAACNEYIINGDSFASIVEARDAAGRVLGGKP